MAIEAELVELLLADPGLSALIGDRLRPSEAGPTDTEGAYVVYRYTEPPLHYTYDGESSVRVGTLIFESWGSDYDEARIVSETLHEAIGPITGPLSARYRVQGLYRERGPDVSALPDHEGKPQAIQGFETEYRLVYDDYGSTAQ